MKNLLFFLLVLFLSGCNQPQEKLSIIDGTWNRGKATTIKLFRTENGQLKEIGSSQPDQDGKFNFAFVPEKASFYTIGAGNQGIHSYVFYFKPGDRLSVAINDSSYTLVGKNTPENAEMERWHNYVLPLERKSIYRSASDYRNFFPTLAEKDGKYQQQYTSNAAFNAAFRDLQIYDMALYALNFLYTPRSAQPSAADYPEFYSRVDIPALTTSGLLEYPAGNRLLSFLRIFNAQQKMKELSPEERELQGGQLHSLENFLPLVTDDTLKGEIVLGNAGGLRSYPAVLAFEEQYGQYLVTENQKKRFETFRNSLADLSAGQPAIDFKFPDLNGKKVALSDFKGNVVYVDLWATWCGYCIAEIPDLKKLEKEYHGKDIVFLSVSIDKEKDHQKWKEFVQKEGLGGVQIFGGDQSQTNVMNPYKVTGIPRFMLFDKAGNIISTDAPRPSSSEIRPMIEAALKSR